MRLLILVTLLMIARPAAGQSDLQQTARKIEREAMQLYRREKASWHGTDLFLERHPDQSSIEGYFSYINQGFPECVFFSRDSVPKVIGTIVFDSTYDVSKAVTDLSERPFSPEEAELYTLRKLAFGAMTTDTIYKFYKNTQPNIIPIIEGGEKKVYIITGTPQQGVVPLGNDYLLTFSDADRLLSFKPLHRSLIILNMQPTDSTGAPEKSMGAVHSHLPGFSPFITPTDICTLMLYQQYTNWKQHIVVSEDYISIWSATPNNVTIITKKSWDRMNGATHKAKK